MLGRLRIPLSWSELLKRTLKEAIADDVLNLAAQQAYYFFFALFPALLALISLASFFTLDSVVNDVVDMLGRIAPPDVVQIVRDQLVQISNSNAGGLLTVAFLFTLWSSSAALVSLISTLNAAYDIIEARPWWKVRLIAITLTIALAFFILVSMTLVVAGPALAEGIANSMGLGAAFEWAWKILQWPVVFALVTSGVATVYYYAPDAEQDWVWITPGSVLATLLWIAISLGFKLYLARFANYNETYGAIGGVMVLMLWFYLSAIALLIGAELNAEIEHASPYGKSPGEKVPGEKKKIGAAAERAFEKRRARGDMPVETFPIGMNCDVDRPVTKEPPRRVRTSDLLIGTAALLPFALKIVRSVRSDATDDRAA